MLETVQFQCHQCHETFYNRIDLEDQPTLLLECPHCGASCSVNLGSHSKEVIEVLRDGQTLTFNTNQLTDKMIPTEKPSE